MTSFVNNFSVSNLHFPRFKFAFSKFLILEQPKKRKYNMFVHVCVCGHSLFGSEPHRSRVKVQETLAYSRNSTSP